MGFKTFGFGGGRVDTWEPEADVYWGPETVWLDDERYSGDRELQEPLGAVQMGLIYVNPEGPNGNPDPLAAARDIRETFGRMAMNDEETVALIAGGHTFGKTHGAGPAENVGPDPEAAPIEQQGFGWKSTYGTGVGMDAITSGSRSPGPTTRPGGTTSSSTSCSPTSGSCSRARPGPTSGGPRAARDDLVPEAGDGRREPRMLTSDLALRFDPIYEPISRRFAGQPGGVRRRVRPRLVQADHRDMGPVVRYLGPRYRPRS